MEKERIQTESSNVEGFRSGNGEGSSGIDDGRPVEGVGSDAGSGGAVRPADQAGGQAGVDEEEFQKGVERERVLREFQKCGIKDGYSDELIQAALEFDPGYSGLQRAECYTLGGLNHGRGTV
jgi:hypothetical protein